MTEKRSDPGFLHRPPKLHPISALIIGGVCIPAGLMIQGGIGGALIGGGIGSLLTGLWDAFRIIAGLVHKPSEESSDPLNGTLNSTQPPSQFKGQSSVTQDT